MKDRKKSKAKAKSSSEESDESDESVDMRAIRKKMSRSKKKESSKKLAARLKQAGLIIQQKTHPQLAQVQVPVRVVAVEKLGEGARLGLGRKLKRGIEKNMTLM